MLLTVNKLNLLVPEFYDIKKDVLHNEQNAINNGLMLKDSNEYVNTIKFEVTKMLHLTYK